MCVGGVLSGSKTAVGAKPLPSPGCCLKHINKQKINKLPTGSCCVLRDMPDPCPKRENNYVEPDRGVRKEEDNTGIF